MAKKETAKAKKDRLAKEAKAKKSKDFQNQNDGKDPVGFKPKGKKATEAIPEQFKFEEINTYFSGTFKKITINDAPTKSDPERKIKNIIMINDVDKGLYQLPSYGHLISIFELEENKIVDGTHVDIIYKKDIPTKKGNDMKKFDVYIG